MIHFRNCKYDHDDTYGLVAQTFAHAFLTLTVHVSLVAFVWALSGSVCLFHIQVVTYHSSIAVSRNTWFWCDLFILTLRELLSIKWSCQVLSFTINLTFQEILYTVSIRSLPLEDPFTYNYIRYNNGRFSPIIW